MSNEILELHKKAAAASSAERVSKQERRQKRRAKVSREMRIRPAHFNDGTFEEVRSTLNVSRDGLYFLTPHDRYRAGMRLRITAAAESSTEGAWEQVGEVVRVHRQGGGFGVAVSLPSPTTKSIGSAGYASAAYPSASYATPSAAYATPSVIYGPATANSTSVKRGERRSATRRPFIASTEVIDVYTGERSQVTTADLSTLGCYIDTVSPLPPDTTVLLQIERDNAVVEFRARVISSQSGTGMGLVFEGITDPQRALLAKWLRGDSEQPASIPAVLPPTTQGDESREDTFGESPRFAKLMEILTRKGVLNEADVASLLREL
jgi:hypothetical protein